MILSHEHLVTNFTGAKDIQLSITNRRNAYRILLPALKKLRKAGVNCLFECTPEFIGRDGVLLRKLSRKSKVFIVTNTGYYAAVDKKYLPDSLKNKSPQEFAARWEEEGADGINKTGIKPGFIKIGVGDGPLDSIEQNLVKAAALVSKQNGYAIAIHTGDYQAALSEYQTASAIGLGPNKLIWVHAQNANDVERKMMAQQGVWISLDGVNEKDLQKYVDAIFFMKDNGLLSRLLISQDDGYSVSNDGRYSKLELFANGNTVPYQTILTKLIPLLRTNGFTDGEVNKLMHDNPVECYGLKE